jgi:hypothetical protein
MSGISDRQLQRLVKLVTNFEEAIKSLPQQEQDEYRRCQQSVIDARRYGERIAHTFWGRVGD